MERRQFHRRGAGARRVVGRQHGGVRPERPAAFADDYGIYRRRPAGPGFGTAIDANDRVWFDSTSGKTISLFDHNGKPLSPPDGYNFGGKLGFMQGIIVTPSGDVWALDFTNDKVVYMPQGDPSKAKFYCESTNGKPNKDSPCKLSGPFGLAIDQQDRIWISNAIGDTVTRFPAAIRARSRSSRPGASGKGMAIDSKGNVWIANTAGRGYR